jgi:hypothetical protein
VKTTTVTELTGMSTAANKGDKVPCTAKNSPVILYKIEIIKLK